MTENDFRSMSVEVAKRFLQTVVVVDDEATFTSEENVSKRNLELPPRPVPVDEDATDEEEEIQEEVPTWDDEAHKLDAKEVIDAFAKQGLVCAILRPESQEEVRQDEGEESLLDRVVRLADRSDLVVLDWDIGKDGGEKTRQIINKLAEVVASSHSKYLRLVVVYTGEGALDKIADAISEVFEPECRQEDGLVLQRGPVRVAVYAKDRARNIGPHGSRRVSFQELPERLITDFAEMTKGIVSNVAVESLSVLRENTHPLLARLHSGLDAPYLTHRLLLSQPDDASDFLVSLIASELRAVLDEYNVGKYASGNATAAWMDSMHGDETQFELGETTVSGADVKEWLHTGSIESIDNNKVESLRNNHFRKMTAHLGGSLTSDEAANLDMEFATLTSLRTRYVGMTTAPMLTLGTILQDITKDVERPYEYWLCIQPRCDSVRLNGDLRPYPLLPYQTKEPNQKKFDLVVRDANKEFVRLKLVNSPSQCRMEPFTPTEEDPHVVRAVKKEDEFIFESAETEGTQQRRYRWIADLKYEQAQRDISSFASYVSSVGLDEFEWLRRSAK